MTNGDDKGAEGDGFPYGVFPVNLNDLLATQRDARSRANMAHSAAEMSVLNFLDGLSVEQLMVMRGILNMDQSSPMNNYYDGLVVGFLHTKHAVDPSTGRGMEELLTSETPVRKED